MFKWKESFSCNIKDIDEQHKRLFEIGSRIYMVVSLKDNYDHYDEIMEIIHELGKYTIYHFQFEEELMKNYNYTNYEAHKIEHDFFIKKLKKIERKDIEGKQTDALLEMVAFVADWVSGHILKSDMEYKEFFSKIGVE